jgi:hypothetical protein
MNNRPSIRSVIVSATSAMTRTPGIALAIALTIALTASLAITGSAGAQTSSPNIVGEWLADVPLSNGAVQTFRFGPDGTFDLATTLVVDGTYRINGNQLIETVTSPGAGATRTDTASFSISGDSLTVSEHAGATARVLHRSGSHPATARSAAARSSADAPIVGDWAIIVGKGTSAHYVFSPDGTMRVRASIGDEQGRYVITADTIHLSNDQTFQIPAIAQFAVTDTVLTLTPSNGKAARRFRKVVPR